MAISNLAVAGELGRAPARPDLDDSDSTGDQGTSLLQTIKPFIAVIAVLATGSMLTAAIYFTLFDIAWTAFLAGVLFASILAMTTQAARSEVTSTSHARSLAMTEYQLTRETSLREKAEENLSAANSRLNYSDVAMPLMVAFVDQNTHYQYHNRAFREWLGLPPRRIDGQHMREVLGRKVFAEVQPYISEMIAGRMVRYERSHKTPTGTLYRLAVQQLPQFDGSGDYAGFYNVITDITERRDLHAIVAANGDAGRADETPLTVQGSDVSTDESAAAMGVEWEEASRRILRAINGNEFTLYCQHITPLARRIDGIARPEYYEVLIRLIEEEDSLVPPGAFFALAEEHGLLPQLDRWVFSHVLEWMATPVGARTVQAGSVYLVNISSATISDADFPEFIAFHLRRTGIPAHSVCIEIAEPDLTLHRGDVEAFARAMRQCGCLIAISGFGRSQFPVEALKLFPVDMLKIDGGIVRQIVAYPTHLGRAATICRVAKAIGIRTIAEMVEDEVTLKLLRKLEVDFAQGFGISRPQPLADLTGPAIAVDVAPSHA